MLTTRHTLKMPVAATGAVDAAGSLPTGTRVTMIVLLVLTMVRTTPAVNSEHREDVQFQITHQTAGPDFSVFVLGSLPELGGGDLTMAVKLVAGEDLLWKVAVSLPTNRTYTYRFYERETTPGQIGDPLNRTPISDVFEAVTSTVLLAPVTKRLLYHSTYDGPILHWRQDSGSYETLAMHEIGPSLNKDELRWLACDFAEARLAIEFFLTNSDGTVRDPVDPTATYQTSLDAFFLQDAHLFTYVPAPHVSPQRREYTVLANGLSSTTIDSDILRGVREYRVMLPRGYDEHTDRSYPVLYIHDGSALWDDFFQTPVDLDGARVAALVRLGQVGEMILVGVDNIELAFCPYYLTRTRDLLPPDDAFDPSGCGFVIGEADQYASFIVTELKPLIDSRYRTLTGPAHTWTAGFSFGGLCSLYMGWDFTEYFTRIGSWSGSFWVPFFTARVMMEPWRDLRIYMDTGTVNKTNLYNANFDLRDNLLCKSPEHYVVERDHRFFVAAGQNHSFMNAGTRSANLLTFLYPATEEPNELTCLADLDCDSLIGITDLLALLAAWGTDPGGPPDFEGDGDVGITDLLALLAAWGPCP